MKALMAVLLAMVCAELACGEEPTGPAVVPERVAHAPVKAGEIRELTIKELGNFDYNPIHGGNVPADVTALSGARIRINGTMTPWRRAGERITQFALTDGESCCFGRPPRIQHVLVVTFPDGVDPGLVNARLVVEGVLTVEEKKSDDFVTGLFQLQATSVSVLAAKPK